MIYFSTYKYGGTPKWRILPANVTFTQANFDLAMIKIDDVIYKGGSREFWAAYDKAKTWDLLHDTGQDW